MTTNKTNNTSTTNATNKEDKKMSKPNTQKANTTKKAAPAAEKKPAPTAEKKERKPRAKVDNFPAILELAKDAHLVAKTTSGGRRIVLAVVRDEKQVPVLLLCRRTVGARVYVHKKGAGDKFDALVTRYKFAPAHDEGASYPVATIIPLADLGKLFAEF